MHMTCCAADVSDAEDVAAADTSAGRCEERFEAAFEVIVLRVMCIVYNP